MRKSSSPTRRIHRAALVAAALIGLQGQPAAAAALETVESGTSTIRISGNIVADASDAKTDGRVSVAAFYGTASTPEIRTAARSALNGELAANVRMDDKNQYSNTNVTETISAATLTYHSAADNAFIRHAAIDFTLPPSFMEVTSNGESPNPALEMVLFADLRVCFATLCGISDSHFSFQSTLTASHQGFTYSATANGDPNLDLEPLRHPFITDVPGFWRTTTLDFAAYHGHLDLGLVPTTAPLTVEYQLQTRGSGRMAANIGLAGINDPFILDTDPVQAGALTLTLTPVQAVPEPQAGTLLIGGGLAVLALARRRRRV